MIYGPYSTGWRDEAERRKEKSAVRWARVGALLVVGGAYLFLGPLKLLLGVL